MPLEFEYCFGYRLNKNSVAFYDEHTILFNAGNICILMDIHSGHQRLFPLAEPAQVSAIVSSENHILAAIRGSPASVCVFETFSETKKFYTGPTSLRSREFTCLSLSANLKFVAAQSGPPEWKLVVWLSNTREMLVILHPCGNDGNCSVQDISFNASGSDELVVVGRGIFKLYEYEVGTAEEASPFVEHVFEQYERSGTYYSIAWPRKEYLAVGNSDGRILFLRGKEIIHEMAVVDDVARLKGLETLDVRRTEVTSVLVASELLLCLISNLVVLVYRGKEIGNYTLTDYIFRTSVSHKLTTTGEMRSDLDLLVNVTISPSGKCLIGTTCEGQLMRFCRFNGEVEGNVLSYLMERQHNEPVMDIDVAISRPLIASCSQHVVTLWNYTSQEQELRKVFRDAISSIAVHPSGFYVALSFRRSCKTFSIVYEDFIERGMIFSANCSKVRFSSPGNLLAIISGSVIEIYCFGSSRLLFKLDGHAALVTCLDWKEDDSKLVSCDKSGVICEWNLVSGDKIWENTAAVSYLSIATNPKTGDVIAVGSNKIVRCLKDALVQWDFQAKEELTSVTFHSRANLFYAGTADGCLLSCTIPPSEESAVIYAHSGRVSAIKITQNILVSAAEDNFIFLHKTTEEDVKTDGGMFSNLSRVESMCLHRQRDRCKQICLALDYVHNVNKCESGRNCVKHDRDLRTLSLDHEEIVYGLNEKIIMTKEETQRSLLEWDPDDIVEEIESNINQDVMNKTLTLDKVHKRSDAYSEENEKIIQKYESAIGLLRKGHAKHTSAEQKAMGEIERKVKRLEDKLLLEEQNAIEEGKVLASEEYKMKIQNDFIDRIINSNKPFKEPLKDEELRSMQLKMDIETLKRMFPFRKEDTEKRKDTTVGQVDHDITEKINTITVLEERLQNLGSSLKAKENLVQTEEEKFCKKRTLFSDWQKRFSVSRTTLEECVGQINSTDTQTRSHKRQMSLVEGSILDLDEELQLSKGFCTAVEKKAGEAVEEFLKKQKVLGETQEIMSKYTSMLHQCLARDCDLQKLLFDIARLFENCRSHDAIDTRLFKEYNFQIDKLKKSYDLIKNEPERAKRDKGMSEFRLSQENAKILRQVHDIQRVSEKLHNTLHLMEGALLLQITSQKRCVEKTPSEEDAMGKMEFVVDMNQREDKMHIIEKFDLFIEEQQKEISRFQTMPFTKSTRA